MKVTYIGHSGFLVETDTVSLLFDYWTGEIPPIPADKPLYIFVSHRHEDHFNPEIFTLPGLPKNTTWILSSDIAEEGLLIRKASICSPLAEAGKLRSLDKDVSYSIGDLEIDTLESTDEGVAFLIEIPAENRLIYHAGDLNWWIWDGEPEADNEYYTVWFKDQVEKLAELVREKKGRLDLAFLTLDPRQEIYEFYGMDWQLQCLPVDVVFPMHCSEDYDVIDRYLELRGDVIREMLPSSERSEQRTIDTSTETAADDSSAEDSSVNDTSADQEIRLAHIRRRGEQYDF